MNNEGASKFKWEEKEYENYVFLKRQQGWIEVFRKKHGKHKALYQLTYKSKRVIASVYSKLNGGTIPTSVFNNKSYMDKVYRNLIEQLRHPSLE